MHRTAYALEHLPGRCCRRLLPAWRGAAMPFWAWSPERQASQKSSVCLCPAPVEPCHSIFSGLKRKSFISNRFLPTSEVCDILLLPSPCAIAEDVSAVKRVDGNVVLYSTVVKNGIPAVEQNLILMTKQIGRRADSLRLVIEMNWNNLLFTCSEQASSKLLKCDFSF